ncbi:hypothetical protein [Reichenbachiella agariperforans]|uniref:hypothetical protein n=1 Tax=Reichenbachiella agariperforans TaxID=156994 RepID=UPI001C09DE6D|nr:hypothetical protein [Reichenbachiella agariperforans]MBU2915964.1 hypothetical protein [Reichenbachiella agariperforans]
MVSINSKTDQAQVDSLVERLNSDESFDIHVDKFILKHPGHLPALINLLSLWALKCGKNKVVLPYRSEAEIEALYAYPLILAAIVFAESSCYLNDKKTKVKKISKIIATSYLEIESIFSYRIKAVLEQERFIKLKSSFEDDTTDKLKWLNNEIKRLEASKKKVSKSLFSNSENRLFIGCFDDFPRLDYPKFFYNTSTLDVSNEKKFSGIIQDAFTNVFLKKTSEVITSGVVNELSSIAFELFHNTDSWAKTDFETGQKYKFNCRGAEISILEDITNQEIQNEDVFASFCKSLTIEKLDRIEYKQQALIPNLSAKKIGLFEISIFDNGPGLSVQWLKKDLDKVASNDEYDAILKCFKKHMTSDPSVKAPFRGNGLSRVIDIIKNRGFIRVRSGRMDLSRNFFQFELNKNQEKESLNFDGKETTKSPVRGTIITVLYPFIYTN